MSKRLYTQQSAFFKILPHKISVQIWIKTKHFVVFLVDLYNYYKFFLNRDLYTS